MHSTCDSYLIIQFKNINVYTKSVTNVKLDFIYSINFKFEDIIL